MGVDPRRRRTAKGRNAVSLRICKDQYALIDRAAGIQGRSLSDFIIEASRRTAEDVILDQRVIIVSEESYDHILAVLDRLPEANEKIAKLFSTKAPWER